MKSREDKGREKNRSYENAYHSCLFFHILAVVLISSCLKLTSSISRPEIFTLCRPTLMSAAATWINKICYHDNSYLTIKWWQTTLAYFGCFDEECWLPLHVTETLKKREIVPVESHFLDMVEKSKPPAAAAKQETLPKRAGGNLLHYYFMVEANFPIFIPINDLSFLLYTRWFWYVVSVRPHIALFVSS